MRFVARKGCSLVVKWYLILVVAILSLSKNNNVTYSPSRYETCEPTQHPPHSMDMLERSSPGIPTKTPQNTGHTSRFILRHRCCPPKPGRKELPCAFGSLFLCAHMVATWPRSDKKRRGGGGQVCRTGLPPPDITTGPVINCCLFPAP